MATAAIPLATGAPLAEPALPGSVWRSPLFPVAGFATLGVVADRALELPLPLALALSGVGLLAWAICLTGGPRGQGVVFLWLTALGLGAGWHHYHTARVPDDHFTTLAHGGPELVTLRGVLAEDFRQVAGEDSFWRGRPWDESWAAVLRVDEMRTEDGWQPASGRAQVFVGRAPPAVERGDRIEVRGRLLPLAGPANPGERDRARLLRDEGIAARMSVASPEGVARLEAGGSTLQGLLIRLRRQAAAPLRELGEPEGRLAQALILGDQQALDRAGWRKYARTGVVHVLVVSGQHLVLLAWLIQKLFDLLRVRQRNAAVGIALVMLGYGTVVGFEPPVLRAVVTVCVFCGAAAMGRMPLTANTFALAWLVVIVVQPSDVFRVGCLYSFLAVAVLFWGAGRWLPSLEPTDPLDVLIEQTRPAWQRWGLAFWRRALAAYWVNALVTLTLLPLIIYHIGDVPWTGLLIGPPVVVLTGIALVAGFLTLLLGMVWAPLAVVPGWVTATSLAGCDRLVNLALLVPGARLSVGPVPAWWVVAFYAVLLVALWARIAPVWWRRLALAGLGWLCLGLALAQVRLPSDECRVTFLAVGRGCCTVVETPDGRVLVYDAGSMSRPGVGRQILVPYLRWRGLRRVDELLLSHADLDHFNAVRDLLDEVPVGQVTCTPSFAERRSPQAVELLSVLQERGVAVRTVSVGDRLTAGEVTLEVLHPPPQGPPGAENVRSLVLLLRHGRHTFLLTGDLEGAGIDRVMGRHREAVDVLMSPHHGSPKNNPEGLARQYRPGLVVSSQGPRDLEGEPYTRHGARYLTTSEHGAITVRSHASGLVVETFLTNERWVLSRSALAENEVQRPAPSHMESRVAQVRQDLGVAPCLLQGVGQHDEAVVVEMASREARLVVGCLSEYTGRRTPPGGIDQDRSEGVAHDVPKKLGLERHFLQPDIFHEGLSGTGCRKCGPGVRHANSHVVYSAGCRFTQQMGRGRRREH